MQELTIIKRHNCCNKLHTVALKQPTLQAAQDLIQSKGGASWES